MQGETRNYCKSIVMAAQLQIVEDRTGLTEHEFCTTCCPAATDKRHSRLSFIDG